MMKRNMWIVLSLLLVVSMMLTACGQATPTEAPKVEEPTTATEAPAVAN